MRGKGEGSQRWPVPDNGNFRFITKAVSVYWHVDGKHLCLIVSRDENIPWPAVFSPFQGLFGCRMRQQRLLIAFIWVRKQNTLLINLAFFNVWMACFVSALWRFILKGFYFDKPAGTLALCLMFTDNASLGSFDSVISIIIWPLGFRTVSG